MNEKLKDSPTSWVDLDDAPELTADFFEQGNWTIGEKKVSAQEGAAALNKSLVTNLPNKKLDELWVKETESRVTAYLEGKLRISSLREVLNKYH